MKYFSGIVKCATCGKALSKAINVPEGATLEAAIAASGRAFCPGHTRNANLDFTWEEQLGGKLPTPPSSEPSLAATEPAPPAQEGEQLTKDGIALSDLEAAAGEPVKPPAVDGAVYVEGENGVPMLVVGKNPPRPEQLG